MKPFWSSRIAGIEPYVPGEQPRDRRYIKLNTNENPYPPSPKALAAIQAAADERLRLYPDPLGLELRTAIAGQYGVSPDQVFVGNGSDEVLAICFLAFFAPGDKVTFWDVTYSFYPVYSAFFQVEPDIVPLNPDFSVPVERLLRLGHGQFVCNPNAPTGMALSLAEIERIVRENPDQVVIVDEAYVDFGAQSAVSLIQTYPNLVVVQTTSKSRSLAGLRVGYAFGDPNLIAALYAARDSFNSYTLDRLALAGATAAVEDTDYFDRRCHQVMETRERTSAGLQALGFTVLPSLANFLFAAHPGVPGETLFQALREEGILVRYFKKPRIDNFLRITIGTDGEMTALLTALQKIIEKR